MHPILGSAGWPKHVKPSRNKTQSVLSGIHHIIMVVLVLQRLKLGPESPSLVHASEEADFSLSDAINSGSRSQ